MRVLVTGGTGYIGRHVVPRLLAQGCEVHVITRRESALTGTVAHHGNLLVPGVAESLVAEVRPEAVLHAAWEATPGAYWTSPDNPAWAAATVALASSARDIGARRFVGVGSSAEYDWTGGHCEEGVTAETPNTPYGQAKQQACEAVLALSRPGFTVAWGRVFFLFGDDEYPSRLVPSVALAIREERPALCSHGEQLRDFLHVEDVDDALVALLTSDVRGAVNIASGEAHRVRDVIEGLANRLGRPDLIRLGARPTDEAPILTAATRRLRDEVGWRPHFSFEAALDAAAAHWTAQSSSQP